MDATFDGLYRQLGRATMWALYAALAFLGVALACALLGFTEPAESLAKAAWVPGYVFAWLLAAFIVTYLVAALVRFLDRRRGSTT